MLDEFAQRVEDLLELAPGTETKGLPAQSLRWIKRYGYDDNGNRTALSYTTNAGSTFTNLSIDPASNRLLAADNPTRVFALDAAGNVVSDNSANMSTRFVIDPSGRIGRFDAASNGVTNSVVYGHDAFGRRVLKYGTVGFTLGCAAPSSGSTCPAPASGGVASVYFYDPAGHLLGEYRLADGSAIREYVWLNDMPVALIDGTPTSPAIAYIQTDHLDTPRTVIDRAGRQRWTWVAEPFGNSASTENPMGFGTFELNLRMPGQYFDAESGLAYNGFRSYDSGVGRYTQSDPIGLVGGINTYSYVGGNPVNGIDPYGLFDIRNPADWPSLPPALVNFFEGYGSYYGGLGNAAVHMYRRSGIAGSCLQQRAVENEAALASALLALSNRDVASQAANAAKAWAGNHKAYLGGRLSAGGVTSAVTGVGPYGGLSLGLVAGMGDALHNIDRANATSAEQVLRSILGDRMPNLPDIRRTECECQK
jgi:RHS repeat-associated protein